ncbi:RraA family protein [Sporosarcina siberiensis]|uniref:Putative 4-hydroxy-4-methyl-2-oxoglutarate aldolase n=1 Tax=Sporosarcina siberiensis TaxID=1365606 RepID=A0ABW4SI28_9BACL
MNPDRFLNEYRIKTKISRLNPSTYKEFLNYPTATVSDAMRGRNTMSQDIKSVWSPVPHLVGSAVTVSASLGDELLILKAIEMAEPGDVIVVAGNAKPYTAYWGGIMSTMAKARGIKGLVTDGMIRDLSECEQLQFPIWATGVTPIGPKTDVPPGELNLPISIGQVIVHPGDLVVADSDGVVVVPQHMLEDISKAVKARLKIEDEWIKEIHATDQMILKDKIDDLLSKRTVTYLD